MTSDRPPDSSRLWLDAGLLILALVLVMSWFGAIPLRRGPILGLAVFGVLTLAWSRRKEILRFRPRLSTVLVCAAAVLLRLPAFLESGGFVGADGSLQAILVNVILKDAPPAPVFLETSSYQGSLKAHLGAIASVFFGREDLGLLVVAGSVVLWTMLVASAMALGRRFGGTVPAVSAGLFLALSPRFVTMFSVSNVGEYPDALGLGTWAMAWAAKLLYERREGSEVRASYLGIGVLLGIAIWQQPIAASFAMVALGALGFRALRSRDRWFLLSLVGVFLGRLPVTLHDLQATSSNNLVVGSFLKTAGQALPLSEHVRGTVEWAFPIVFAGLTNDFDWTAPGRITVGLLCFALILFLVARATSDLRGAVRDRSWEIVRAMAALNFLVGLAFIWLIAGGGQYNRPRYFLPLLTGFALAFGDLIGVTWRRSRALAIAVAVVVIGWNGFSNVARIESGLVDGRSLRLLAERVEALDLKTGYSGVAVAGPLTMMTGERVSVDGVLDSSVGERLPARHVERVRRFGPDFYLTDADQTEKVRARLEELGVAYKSESIGMTLFYGLSRRVPLAEMTQRVE